MVCRHPHLISCREKQKMVLQYIDGNIDIVTHISEYPCLKHPSCRNHFQMTRLQYNMLKYLRTISSFIVKICVKLGLCYYSSNSLFTWGPLTCDQRSLYFITLFPIHIKSHHQHPIPFNQLSWTTIPVHGMQAPTSDILQRKAENGPSVH